MIETTGNDLVIIASDPQELVESQHATIEKVREKERAAEIEVRQASVTVDAGSRAGINVAPAKRILSKCKSRLLYLGKIREALEAGYVIVPNFPGETIAVRVRRTMPAASDSEGSTHWSAERNLSDEQSESLPVGSGNYINPSQRIRTTQHEKPKAGHPGETETVYITSAIALQETISMPAEFLRPTVVEMTGKCMARRIFDEVAISSNATAARSSRRGDPMVIGRIIDRQAKRTISFLVAWFIDTSTI